MMKAYMTDLRQEFAGYNREKLTGDLMAGATVAAVALPLALAFGVSSGADAAAGLITAILAGIVIGLLSGASYQISGPTGAMSAILLTIVPRYGLEGVFLATLVAGILLIVMGVFRVGRMVSVIPMPVITGFTSGIAILIALGQVDNFFGTVSRGDSVVEKLISYRQLGFQPNWQTLSIGLFVILLMSFWPKKWQAILPSSLAALILVTAANSLLLHWQVAQVGAIPPTLLPANRLALSAISWSSVSGLFLPALSIAALGMIESLLCGASAGRMKEEEMDADRELVAQGIGNVIIPFFGGVPATAAIARTSVAIRAGQKTRLTSIFHAAGLLLSMFLLAPIMSQIPMAALAGVLMVTAFRMNEWHTIRYLFGRKLKSASLEFLLTMVITVVFDLSTAIVAGVAFCSLMFTVKVANLVEIELSSIDPERLRQRDLHFHPSYERVKVAYVMGSLFFGSAQYARKRLDAGIAEGDVLILSLRGLSAMDSTGAHMLLQFCHKAQTQGVHLYFAGVQRQVQTQLKRGGIVDFVGQENFLWSTEEALERVASGEI